MIALYIFGYLLLGVVVALVALYIASLVLNIGDGNSVEEAGEEFRDVLEEIFVEPDGELVMMFVIGVILWPILIPVGIAIGLWFLLRLVIIAIFFGDREED